MTDILILTLLILAIGLFLVLLGMQLAKWRRQHPTAPLVTTETPWATFLDLLRRAEATQIEEHPSEKGEGTSFYWRGGYFVVHREENKNMLDTFFFNIFDLEMEALHAVRSVCNRYNVERLSSKFAAYQTCYTIDNETNRLRIHLRFSFNLNDVPQMEVAEMKEVLHHCFESRELLDEWLTEINENVATQGVNDPEEAGMEERREMLLLLEQEYGHGLEESFHFSSTQPITLQHWVAAFTDLQPLAYVELVQPSDVTPLTESSAIARYNLLSALLDESGTIVRPFATLQLSLTTGTPERPVLCYRVFTLQVEGESDTTVYVRVTCHVPASDTAYQWLHGTNAKAVEPPLTSLIGFDKQSDRQRDLEFLYEWSEMRQKVKAGKKAELTPEQEILYAIEQEEAGKVLYRGIRHYQQRRYAEAILVLSGLWGQLRAGIENQSAATKNNFVLLTRYLALSYMNMGAYERALYYFNTFSYLMKDQVDIAHVQCMVAGNDIRTLEHLTKLSSVLQDKMQAGGTRSDGTDYERLSAHLQQLHAYYLVENHFIDEAKILLDEMLKNKRTEDFAIHELAYLQKHVCNDERPSA